jgi:predicted nucleotidyltransferase
VDSRGAAPRPVADPSGALRQLAERAGEEFPHLFAARRYTAKRVSQLRVSLEGACPRSGASIVVFGSWAREELTTESDDDWAVIYRGPLTRSSPALIEAVTAAKRHLGREGHAPGKQDIFGNPFRFEPLVGEIGLDRDTNRNMTRRMLLLLESTVIAGEDEMVLRDRVLDRYLNYAARPNRPPRFLLNDIVRYWRTIGVDFEGKHRDTQGDGPKWVVRNAKLRTSRKMLFAGGLLPTLLCGAEDREAMSTFLRTWFAAPASDRVAQAFLTFEAVPEGVRAFGAYDRWMAIQRDKEKREALADLTFETRETSPLFSDVRKIGRELDRALSALLFDTKLHRLARQYLVF